MKRIILAALVGVLVSGCGSVRQKDLDAWVGQPVEALDLQPFFLTLPMVKRVSQSGVEIRNYIDGRNIGNCFGSGHIHGMTYTSVGYSQFSNCVSSFGACNNIFYIKNGKILEYAPTASGSGWCYTDDSVLPSSRRF